MAAIDSAALETRLATFLAACSGPQQHSAEWYAAMGTTVGGSELAAVMGMNPYSSYADVVRAKADTLLGKPRWPGSPACWWGSLFEKVICSFVELDLKAAVAGRGACIQAYPGHRCSPDGYIVAALPGGDGRPEVALLEFKCPLSRRPRGTIPPHYLPQVLSGLAVSPAADCGLFVDALFRRCALADLGASEAYDASYHGRARLGPPLAWGLVRLYSRGPECLPLAVGLAAPAGAPADAGVIPADAFSELLGLIDQGVVAAVPCIEGTARGGPAPAPAPAPAPGPEHRLVGLLPWKLFRVDYLRVERSPGFMEAALPLIAGVHLAAAAAVASGHPEQYIASRYDNGMAAPKIKAADIQDLFDLI